MTKELGTGAAPVLRVALILVLILSVGQTAAAKSKASCFGKRPTIVRGSGHDVVRGTNKADVIVSGGGNDRITGVGGGDKICAGPGNDFVVAGQGKDLVLGGDGSDTIAGGRGGDIVNGGAGAGDVLRGGRDGDRLHGGPGDHDNVDGGLGDDRVYGDDGNGDLVVGNLGTDKVFGGSGDSDVVRGDLGNDVVDGGSGAHDVASFLTATPESDDPSLHPGVIVSIGEPRGHQIGESQGDGNDDLYNLEDLAGSPYRDIMSARQSDNVLEGGGGDDTLSGGDGHDTALGGPGSDVCSEDVEIIESCNDRETSIDGARVELDRSISGATTLLVSATESSERIAVALSGGSYEVEVPSGISPAPFTGCSTSASGARCPAPGVGQIIVLAQGGNDSVSIDKSIPASVPAKIDGGAGNDRLEGGPGDDLIESGGSGVDVLIGGSGSDGLLANSQGNVLDGGAGADLLVTSNACGGHQFIGGSGEDNVSFARQRDVGVIARLGKLARSRTKGPCDSSNLKGGNESLEGTERNDVLIGDGGSNRIVGRRGSDVLRAGGGKDFVLARDNWRDKVVDCGGGNGDRAQWDPAADPRPTGCKQG